MILCIETSTKVCSVCISDCGEAKYLAEDKAATYSHAEKLNVLIDEVVQNLPNAYRDLSAVAVSKGPGSYTGLRIGVSAAKGIAFSLNIPMIAIGSLRALADQIADGNSDTLLIPMIDARRMEVYCEGFDGAGKPVFPTRAQILDHESFPEAADFKQVYFFGDGAEKCRELYEELDFKFKEIDSSSTGMAQVAFDALKQKDFVSTAYFEPYYLKDFVAGKKPKI